MKRPAKASLAFKAENPSKKVSFGDNVINKLKAAADGGKSPYADTPVSIEQLTADNANLALCVANAKSGAFVDTDALADALVEWDSDFTLFTNFVSTLAAGNLVLIRNAGLVPTKTEIQKKPLPDSAVGMVATINGKKGAIVAETKNAISFAKAYVCTVMPPGTSFSLNNNVMTITINGVSCFVALGTKKKFDVENLPKGVPLSVSMFGFNSTGNGAAAPAQQVTTQGGDGQ